MYDFDSLEEDQDEAIDNTTVEHNVTEELTVMLDFNGVGDVDLEYELE